MIRRLYVDNFRSLVDFTWEPGKECLVLGYNGSGKTSALDAIDIVKTFCTRPQSAKYHSLWSINRTSWQSESKMRFELDVSLYGKLYRYRLILDADDGSAESHIASESLDLDGRLLFEREGQRARLNQVGQPTAQFPVASEVSVVSTVGATLGGEEIVPFRNYLEAVLMLKPLPDRMHWLATAKADSPQADLHNIVAWYVGLLDSPDFARVFEGYLRDVWPDLVEVLTPSPTPNSYYLEFKFRKSDSTTPLGVRFDQMSDGEKMLVGLYMVAAYQRTHPPTTIIIDEPDNFVSLLEIQPWLLTMLDDRPDDGQLILVSHNHEIIQTMGRWRATYFHRDNHLSPAKVSPLPPDETGLRLPELLARGWVDV